MTATLSISYVNIYGLNAIDWLLPRVISMVPPYKGLLSLSEEIIRPNKIDLTWQDLNGEIHNDSPDGLLTICIQHEMDHLEGKLMVDYISPIKRDRIRKKLSK